MAVYEEKAMMTTKKYHQMAKKKSNGKKSFFIILSLEVQPWNFSDTSILKQFCIEFIEHAKTGGLNL